MFTKIKNKLVNTEEKKRLVSNVFSLGLLQGANYLLPLLTVPYLVRVLGPDLFGLLAFSTAFIAFFVLITDYGFNLTATRQISIYRDDEKKVEKVFNSVMAIKSILMLMSFLILTFIVFSFEKFSRDWEVYFVAFGTVVGQVLLPVWFFQGMEKMKHVTYLNLFSKVFFTICIFSFVKEKSDYLLVPTFTALGFLVSGLLSLYIVRRKFNIRCKLQPLHELRAQLYDGWHVFLSSMAVSLYTISTTFILGMFASNTVVGYFSAADKVVQAAKGVYQPVSQAIFPLIGKKLNEDKSAGLSFIHKTTWIVGSGMLSISILLFISAEPIVNLLLGDQYQQSIPLLKIMSFLPFIIALSNMYGIQTMLNLGFKRAFSRILISAAILGLFLSFYLVPVYDDIGTAVTLLVVEIFVTVVMFSFLKIKSQVNL